MRRVAPRRLLGRGATPAALAALTAAALLLRGRSLGAPLWMDEGIAVGIASHPLGDIPSLLRLDGSPPLYYVVLHVWMAVAGDTEAVLRWPSVAFAAAAVLAAGSSFLTSYAHQARMYTLVVLLGLLCTGWFVRAFGRGRRRCAVPFGVALAACLYAHNWALLLAAGFALGVAVVAVAARERRGAVLRDGAVGFGVAVVLYAPWVPTVLFQRRHTGAPWAAAPSAAAVPEGLERILGPAPAVVALCVAAAWALARPAGGPAARRTAAALLATAAFPLAAGWAVSQVDPIWDPRYLAVVLAPALVLAADGLARAGPAGLAALAGTAVLCAAAGAPAPAGDAAGIARAAAPALRPGDLVVSTALAQVPVLAHYLPAGLRYASPLGAVRDPRVVDWRDAVSRLQRASARRLEPLVAAVPRGGHVLLVDPVWDARSAHTAFGRAARRQARADDRLLRRDRRLRLVAVVSPPSGRVEGALGARLLRRRRGV
jgi:mannosyltransferase